MFDMMPTGQGRFGAASPLQHRKARFPEAPMSSPVPVRSALLARLLREEEGTTTIEYGLIAFVVSLSVLAGASALGLSLGDVFQDVDDVIRAVFSG
jgi:pilus assembly protein Flp/PilA